ncbi:MAG: hypothetical protein OXF50_24250 [Caldilineaceae bacterium]|nr:hypothetical protein [Caldilineaceae bacterium]
MGPRFKLSNSDTGLDWPAGVRSVEGYHLVDDQLGLKQCLEAEPGHVLNEKFDARPH